MTKKTKSNYKEQVLEELNTQITVKKRALMDELFTAITHETALNDLEATHKRLDVLAVKEDALNRVKGSIGTIMMQIALGEKDLSEKKAKKAKK